MASHSSRPRVTPVLPRPTRGQVVWWVIGGVVAAAAFTAAALSANGHALPGVGDDQGAGLPGAGETVADQVLVDTTLPDLQLAA